MKKRLLVFALLGLACLCGCQKEVKTLDVFYTSDVQGFFWTRPEPRFGNREVGGYAVLKNFLAAQKQPYILLDGGNWFITADRVGGAWGGYKYTLVRPFEDTRTFCIPDLTHEDSVLMCTDFMGVDTPEELPADPRPWTADGRRFE